MASKKKFKINFDACVSISFCVASLLIFFLDNFALKNYSLTQNIFSAPGAKGAAQAFNFSSPASYARLFLFVFGNQNFLQALFSCAFILPFGALMEERYGSPAVALMTSICAFVTGALNACLVPQALCGAASVALMLILLSSITSIAKNEIHLSSLLTLFLCLTGNLYLASMNGGLDRLAVTSIFVQLAGALAGSMAGFLTAPKTRRTAAAASASSSNAERLQEIDNNSPRKKSFWGNKKADDETTVIGSINI
ncbi:MAG: rhomboid family intramembrane serine protease [Treponema sp.]|nr:rhomboid family intramembrane serine protease [Treponema sp.]